MRKRHSKIRFRFTACAACALILAVALMYERARANDGVLDTSFGGGSGTVITDFSADGEAYAVAIQPDGRIVVSGLSRPDSDTSHNRAALARYNPDGSLDTSFGNGGRVTTTTNMYQGFAVAIQPDGKILTTGFGSNNVTRFNSDGTLDASFGTGGATGFLLNPYTLILQPDGKILIGGYDIVAYRVFNFAVARYNTDGSIDTSFGNGGMVTTQFFGGHDEIHALALQPDGKIVAAGQTTSGDYYLAALARYDANGNLDTSFGSSGKVTTDFSPNDGMKYHRFYGVAVGPDGKILAAGATRHYGTWDSFAIARYNTNGSPDSTFGNNSQVTTRIFGQNSTGNALALQPGGKFFVAGCATTGYSCAGGGGSFALAHYNQDGTLDTSFGTSNNGQVLTQIGGYGDAASAMALQADGKVVLAGSSQYWSGNYNFALARYQARAVRAAFDFNGDGRADPSVFCQSDGTWYRLNMADGAISSNQWGADSDKLVPGDYDGDGRTDIAVYRPSDGNWYIRNSASNTVTIKGWGANTDIPVPGDYDGDGKTDIAVYRPGEGNWYIINSATNSVTMRGWGASTDKPVEGDYDGDRRTDIAVYRPSDGNWYIIRSSDGAVHVQQWGDSTDKPVQADYDGDGRTDVAVYRAGTWYIHYWTNAQTVKDWGDSSDTPVPADYDGDGKADIAVYRAGEGNWYILQSSTGTMNIQYLGGSGDVPLPSAYLPQ
ncbi:MAG: VCBS repeat-containing protein [Pyrinomonadaceae bacterium]|nr:VCBS repeat-containing protein [Pyrinomonadaceae bacterium]